MGVTKKEVSIVIGFIAVLWAICFGLYGLIAATAFLRHVLHDYAGVSWVSSAPIAVGISASVVLFPLGLLLLWGDRYRKAGED